MRLSHNLAPLLFPGHNHSLSPKMIRLDKLSKGSSKLTEVNGLRNQLISITFSRKEGRGPTMPMEDLASETCQACN